MRFCDLEQGTPAWLDWRAKRLGASDATIVMRCPVPWPDPQTPHSLWLRKTNRAGDQLGSFAMRRGNRLEPIARKLYEQRFGTPMAPACGVHDRLDWLAVSLDGLSPWADTVLEIKAPNIKAHREAMAGKVPSYYVPQVQHQLLVSGAERLHYWSYSEHDSLSPAERTALVEVLPDREYLFELLITESAFWACVMLDRDPDGIGVAA